MQFEALYHMVILIEENKPDLLLDIRYNSPYLPYPFVTKSLDYPDIFATESRDFLQKKCTKFRESTEILVQTYNFDIMSSEKRPNKVAEVLRTDVETEQVAFTCGNPIVETTSGNIHIYKNKNEVTRCKMAGFSTILCMFSVPAYIDVKELLSFINPMKETIEQLKIVKYNEPNRYIALLKFRKSEDADHFYDAYNDTYYNGLESEMCRLMYVSHIEVTNSMNVFPDKCLRELPSCAVCLDRLDEPVHGLLTTILCNHTFHDHCIVRVEDTTCPVCRYVQSPEMISESQCSNCDIREQLWICLICGYVGCGRYGRKHAKLHFIETGHTFALELGTNHVWDYVDDTYVHRLAINQDDGKLVQLASTSEPDGKKIDLINMEFNSLLTCHLQSQRHYFEEQLNSLNDRVQKAESDAEAAIRRAHKKEEELTTVLKENGTCSRKLQQATALAQKLQMQLEEERAINESLIQNKETWRTRAEKAEAEAKTAREECHELLLNLELRDKLNQIGSELSKGEIENCEISLETKNTTNRRRRKR